MEDNEKVRTFISRNGNEVTVVGEIDTKAWAIKIKQVLDDLEAGRYKKDKQKPTDD